MHACAADAVGVKELDEIGVDQVGSHLPAAAALLVAFQHAPGAVVEHHHNGVDAVLDGSAQLLGVVLKAAIAGYADDRGLRAAHFGAHGRRESETEAGPAVRVHIAAGAVHWQAAHGPVGRHRSVQRKDGIVGYYGADGFPGAQFRPPFLLQAGVNPLFQGGNFGAVGIAGRYVVIAGGVQELAGYGAAVGGDADGGIVVLADIIRIQQRVNDGFRQLDANAGSGTIGQIAAQHQGDIAIAEPVQDGIVAPDAVAQRHAQRQGMIFGESAFGAVAGYDGGAEAFRQGDYVVCAAGGMDFLA